MNDNWMDLYKSYVFFADRKNKMAATAGQSLTLDPMGINTKFFLSETAKPIELNFGMDDHWMDLYKSDVFFGRSEKQDGRHRRT